MDKYGVIHTHEALRNRLLNYIDTEYLGKNDALRFACDDELHAEGTLFQEPYIEANNAYLTVQNGIENSNINNDARDILMHMSKRNLGVFSHPYKHQIDALEAYFSGKDLMVSTGTGSGKTECFMWSLASKLCLEIKNSPDTWKIRGVRAIMLYPMNALVSDQLGRLRKMIGNSANGFHDIIREINPNSRVPQFGMYTGRTPYPGMPDEKQNKYLAQTMTKDILNQSSDVINKLKELGKYPSKKDLSSFINRLENNDEILTDEGDAELITRQEMHRFCPDILITNYSMLEYMLIRPVEKGIWDKTKEWLNSNQDNKLLFIIDEAHMYRGSSGGEVALLIRRVLHKLGISRNRVQFILTTASVPSEKDKVSQIYKFACDLTAQSPENNTFVLIEGTQELVEINGREFNPELLFDFNIDSLHGTWEEKSASIKEFAQIVGFDFGCDYTSETSVGCWLYDQLKTCNPMLRIMKQTRGNATSFAELSAIAFPDADKNIAEKATSVLLAIAPLAKNANGNVLFPARLHMMFRGLKGLYACANPQCNQKSNPNSPEELGKIYINKTGMRCNCGGMIYELLNERSCGALFLKGYINTTFDELFVWNEPGVIAPVGLKEVLLYLIPSDGTFKRSKNQKIAWLNSITGKLDIFNDHTGEPSYVRVAYCDEESGSTSNFWAFKTCPKCEKRSFWASDFATKGNEPFFNIVSEQFYSQPPIPKYKDSVNEGRKVLLFSDSRQRAAILARDLTKAADEEAMKKALTVAAFELQQWAEENEDIPRLSYLYVAFLKVAYEHRLRFFYGEDEKSLVKALNDMGELLAKRNGKVKFSKYALKPEYEYKPAQYNEHLLRQLCSSFRSLTDIGLCWFEPAYDEEDIDELTEELIKNNISMSYDEFVKIFAAWAMEITTSVYAIGPQIKDEVRRKITPYYQRLGIENETELPPRIKNILKEHDFTEEQIKSLTNILAKFLTQGDGEEHKTSTKYLSLDSVQLKFGIDHEWYKCPRCSGIFPFTLWGNCAHCGKGFPKLMTESEFSGVNFWREPVIKAIYGDPQALMTRINTEEHTAQLSHKDQRQETWSTTEDFEMRFQNVFVNNDRPVDILSCTTTMEVGIDIGSLTAVGLRNIPPMRENYQQRAGRAGRRSAAISTIVTYTDNRPHDSYYFHNPEKIISGAPRTPWIDVDNITLAYRHLNVICFTDYFTKIEKGPDKIGICKFFKDNYEDFKTFLSTLQWDKLDMPSLLPQGIDFNFDLYMRDFLSKLAELKNHVEAFSEEYQDDNENETSTLDVLLESGIFPTYSFPKDVVGFYVENRNGSKIEQKPERALELAISEYAPGRLVVINKTTYKSGGIYSHHSKFKKGCYEHPARAFFESQEYLKILYYCEDNACNWMGLEQVSKCPFCGKSTIKTQNLLKPWGFAPIAGVPTNDVDAEAEMTYAEDPYYSVTPREDEMKSSKSFKNLRYARRANDPLIILNKGERAKGFVVCKDCGAAATGDDEKELKWMPYRHPYTQFKCKHPQSSIINTYLGSQFRTDFVVYEIALNSDDINTDTSGLWICRAAQTLAEAMTIAGGRLLDVEFNEIKSGYRIRYSQEINKTFVDVFLFDSLSSGAGYCAELAERTDELMESTRVVLESCSAECDCACHECLMHFWNQRVHYLLDRFAALDLLKWCKNSSLPSALSFEQQEKLLSPLNELGSDYKVLGNGSKHFVLKDGKKTEIVAYPAMWNKESRNIPIGAIPIPDLILKYALPMADSIIHTLL